MEAKKLTKAEWNNLIEQLLERDKKLVGTVFLPPRPGPNVPYHVPVVPPDRIVTARMIHNYAMGQMGDPDPLYTDPDYGKYTRYGSMIAPPTLLMIFGLDVPRLNGPDFPGANEFQGGTSYDYSTNKVIRPGDEIRTIGKYLGYKEITDPSKPYRLFRLQSKTTCYNQRDDVVCTAIGTAIFQFTYPGDVDTMSGTLFKGREKKPHYTKEQLDMIHQWYEEELEGKHRRGAEIRYWEDVVEGEELPPVIEGPLQITDAVAGSLVGWGAFAAGWLEVKKQLGRAIIDPETGEYQHGVVWHYNDAIAQLAGLPRAQGFGVQSEASLAHLACNWMGDDGWVKRLDIQDRGVRLFGDMMYVKGKVVKKHVENGEHVVDLQLWAETQDGILITKGTATVRLVPKSG